MTSVVSKTTTSAGSAREMGGTDRDIFETERRLDGRHTGIISKIVHEPSPGSVPATPTEPAQRRNHGW